MSILFRLRILPVLACVVAAAYAVPAYAASIMGDYGVSTTGYIQSGGISATNISATRITGDGSGLTNLSATPDSIVSGSAYVKLNGSTSLDYVTGANAVLNVLGSTTGDTSIQLGNGRTGNGNAYVDLVGDTTYTDYGLRIIRASNGANAISSISHRGTGSLNIQTVDAAPILFVASSNESMRINPNGFVGINTTVPGYILDVSGSGPVAQFGSSALANQYITLRGIFAGTALGLTTNYNSNGDTILQGGSNKGMAFVVSSTTFAGAQPSLYINNQGLVGIGTVAPSTTLHIIGSIRSDGYNSNFNNTLNTSASLVITGDSAPQSSVPFGDWQYNGQLIIRSNSSNSSKHLALGVDTTTSPMVGIIQSMESAVVARTLSLNPTGGSVGIGTTTPANPLDVSGSIRAVSINGSGYIALTAQTTSATSFADLALLRASDYWWWSNRTTGLQLINSQNAASSFSTPMVISGTTGHVGIGITIPKQMLHVVDTATSAKTSAQFGTSSSSLFISSPYVSANTYYDGTNWRYEANGVGAILSMSGGTYGLYTMASGTAGNTGTPISLMTVDASGNLNIGGAASKPGGGAWTASSDIRLKNVDSGYTGGLAQIVALQPVRFHYKKDNPRHEPTDKQYIGLVAQQAQKVMPETVSTGKDGYLNLDSTPITFALINAVKELNTRNQQLTADVADLKAQLNQLRLQLNLKH